MHGNHRLRMTGESAPGNSSLPKPNGWLLLARNSSNLEHWWLGPHFQLLHLPYFPRTSLHTTDTLAYCLLWSQLHCFIKRLCPLWIGGYQYGIDMYPMPQPSHQDMQRSADTVQEQCNQCEMPSNSKVIAMGTRNPQPHSRSVYLVDRLKYPLDRRNPFLLLLDWAKLRS